MTLSQMLPPDSEYEKGYTTYTSYRDHKRCLFVGLYHEETESQLGEVTLEWRLDRERGPSLELPARHFHLFDEIPEFFQWLAAAPADVQRSAVLSYLEENGFRSFD